MRLRGLYAITPDAADSESLVELVRRALEHAPDGGWAALQYRNKLAGTAQRRHEARELAQLARQKGAAFIVNDDLPLALEVDADGVHLGRDDGALGDARRLLGGRLLGASCYDRLDLARVAVAAGADYVAFGSVFPSATKPGAVRAPLALFGAARELGVPLVAIGGITLDRVPELIAAGVDCVAVIADLFEAPDVGARALDYARLFHRHDLASA
jgi:thiamine-phosphate pyrophosphorylase